MCEQNLPKGEKGGRHQTCSFFIPQMVLLEKESGADPLGAERLQGDGPSWASFKALLPTPWRFPELLGSRACGSVSASQPSPA